MALTFRGKMASCEGVLSTANSKFITSYTVISYQAYAKRGCLSEARALNKLRRYNTRPI